MGRERYGRAGLEGTLSEAFEQALAYLEGLPERAVGSRAGLEELRAALGGPLPEQPVEAREVVAALATAAEPGLVASSSGRFFGFVIGGALPAALAADWLTTTWDQNAGLHVAGPAAGVVEEVAGRWLAELLGLQAQVSVGFVTGGQMANFTALAAARHEVLGRAGHDVEAAGLIGAPPLRVLAGEGAPRHHRPGVAVPRPGHRRDRPGRRRRAGPHAAGCVAAGARWRGRAGDRLRAGRQRQHRRRRPAAGDLRARPPGGGVGAR
jgi:hypothetical protein